MNIELLISSSEVEQRISQMADSILTDYLNPSPLFVALLRGAAPFASKLMFALTEKAPDFHPEIDYMMISTYGTDRQAGKPQIVTDLAPSTVLAGRDVIVLDDVLDKGITAQFVTDYLLSNGARSVDIAVLAIKDTERFFPVTPRYHCFKVDDVWLVGMGMDDHATTKEAYRWRSDIAKII